MNDLSPKARAVVEAGRNPGVFTPMDRDRIRQGLRVRLATLGAVTATAGSAAAMSMAAKIAVVTAVAAVLGGGVASFWALREPAPAPGPAARDSSSARPPAGTMPQAATPVPEKTAPPLPSGALPSNDIRKGSKRPLATGTPATEERAAPPLDVELSLLRQAREDLRTGAPASAYQRLVDYDRRYGKGPLWQERQALAAVALCQWRPGPQAQARAAEFLRNAPQSPLADRVRSACQSVNAAVE
jgi:hypothetical protein